VNMQAGLSRIVPASGRRLVKQGVNVAMFALPYHTQRKPRGKKAIHNFLSAIWCTWCRRPINPGGRPGAGRVVKEQGCPRIGLWGISSARG